MHWVWGLVLALAWGMGNSKACAENYVLGWGMNADGQASPTPTNVMDGATAIAAGWHHSLAVKEGCVYAWGCTNEGQATVPYDAQSDVRSVAAGESFSLALRTNGQVVVWGISAVTTKLPNEATNGVTCIAAGQGHALAVKDGGVLAFGTNSYAVECAVPEGARSNVVQVAAGAHFSLALRQDGTIVGWGVNDNGETDIPAAASSGVRAIAAGHYHALALKTDGSVVEWGHTTNSYVLPEAVTSGVTAIAAGYEFSMALKEDGSLVVWGDNSTDQTNLPFYTDAGVSVIAAGYGHCLTMGAGLPPRVMEEVIPSPAYVARAYHGHLTVTGMPAVVYAKGGAAWPSWLSIHPSTGALSGTPTETARVARISILASNIYGMTSNMYEIAVDGTPIDPPYFITQSPIPDGEVGTPYSFTFQASNAPIFYASQTNNYPLPDGLTLAEDGTLSGTPTAEFASTFFVTITNESGFEETPFTVAIRLPTEPPAFQTASPLEHGICSNAYSMQLMATRNPTFSLSSGSLPPGLGMTSSGLISGTPVVPGAYAFTVQATNHIGAVTRDYELEIWCRPYFITATNLSGGYVNSPYSQTLLTMACPPASFTLWSGNTLPPGLNLATNGIISGTPTTEGTYSFSVMATNDMPGIGVSRRFTIVVSRLTDPPVILTTSPLPLAFVNNVYSQQLVATQSPLFSITAGSLPPGLDMTSSGLISGTPTTQDSYTFTVMATNDGGYASREYALTVTTGTGPRFLSMTTSNGQVRLTWTNPTVFVPTLESATNIVLHPNWTSLGEQPNQSWGTNTSGDGPVYYRLRILP